RAATPGIMDHPSKKNILTDVKKDNALEKYGDKVIDIVRVLDNEDVSNLSTIKASNKCDWADWIIVREGKGSRQIGSLVNGVYKMRDEISEDWVLIDAGSIMVHLFTEEAHDLYDLETLGKYFRDRKTINH
ncbi:4777_t:CDS:2, partial [Ambispora leptoticha]